MTRETWATRAGFILAAVGSAVGLGNVWRFPWVTAENGGSAFLAVYLGVVLLVGVPGLLGEFVIGRRSGRNPVGALRELGVSRSWGYVGLFSAVTALVLLSFYSVVGGWIVRYAFETAAGLAVGGSAPYFSNPSPYFDGVAAGLDAVAYHLVFLGITAAIVLGGIRKGIERATTVMMPAIAVFLLGLAAWAGTRPGAGAGCAFFLSFDLATLRANFFDVLGPAAGQALFTLSLGAGTMVTYASYLGEDRSLPVDATTIAVLNTAVGVVVGLVVFPLLFAQGVDPTTTGTGPGALFVGLAGAFSTLPVGTLVASVFFVVVGLAAVSSSISMLEIPVSVLVDEVGVSRGVAVAGAAGLVALTGTVTALRPTVFDFVAGTLVDLLLTAGLAVFLLFVGWVLGRDATSEFRTGAGETVSALADLWRIAVGVVLPLFLLFTLLTSLGFTGFVTDLGLSASAGFWATVVVAAAGVAAAALGLRGRTAA
jgi:NSS family neurotransmitter:Na+ symporter